MSYTAHTLLPTTLVGSYAQPDWLIDRKKNSQPAFHRAPGRWSFGALRPTGWPRPRTMRP